jgi:CxxC-x17-CxxC domain-containing protein
MVYTDRTLTCADCNASFTFSVGEQEFFETKGFTRDPQRCPDCRAARKNNRSNDGGGGYSRGGGDRTMHDVVCSQCGKNTQVPFVPSGSRPVYCSDCFRQQRGDSRDSRGGGGGSRSRSGRW